MKLERLQLLDKLLKQKAIYDLRQSLLNINEDTNPNYNFLQTAIKEQKYNEKGELVKGFRGCGLEGSSRSGKTWSGIDLIMWLCLYVEESCTINIYRQTYNEFKTTLYDDFKRRLDDYGLPNPFHNAKEVKSFKIGKSTIYFLGDGKHGGGCDYAFFNEVMFIENSVFDQTEMRCRKFWWADYNPSVTQHWFFDKVLSRHDVGFLRTTYLDNKFVSVQERNKILGYEPWKPNSYIVKDNVLLCYNKQTNKVEPITSQNQPPPNVNNVEQGTADEFMWKVYGLGMRGAMKGVIFAHVEYVDEFPDMGYSYGLDFGFTTDPTALTKCAEDDKNIWIELLCYEPIETPEAISNFFESIGVDKSLPITCDSSDKYTGENKGTVEMVKGLKKLGWKTSKVSKTKSIMFWLQSMKSKKIHIVKNRMYQQMKKEQENYTMREINGIAINQPIDKFNHAWDSARYRHMAFNSSNTYLSTDKSLEELGINY